MAIDVYWGSGSPYSWRVLLALEHKRVPYRGHLLQSTKLEHNSPEMLRLNPRGRVPVLKDGDFVCYESLAILTYLERKFPEPAMFGVDPENAATIMQLICEYQAYLEAYINQVAAAVFSQETSEQSPDVKYALDAIVTEARLLESRLSAAPWLGGQLFSAADAVIFPGWQLLLRALERREAQDWRARLLPLDANFPSIGAWVRRVESLPGYDRTYPPHWRG